jgi:hypothetical protein
VAGAATSIGDDEAAGGRIDHHLSTNLDSVKREPAACAHHESCDTSVNDDLANGIVQPDRRRSLVVRGRHTRGRLLNVENQFLTTGEVSTQVNEGPSDAAV